METYEQPLPNQTERSLIQLPKGPINPYLYKIVRFADVLNMVSTGYVPHQPDDLTYRGICFYAADDVSAAAVKYFDIDESTWKQKIRVYHIDVYNAITRNYKLVIDDDGTQMLIAGDHATTAAVPDPYLSHYKNRILDTYLDIKYLVQRVAPS